MDHIESSVLIDDMRKIIAQSEQLLRATAGDASEKVVHAREQTEALLHEARKRLAAAERSLLSRARAVTRQADRYVHDNPWGSMGVAAVLGILAGALLGRR